MTKQNITNTNGRFGGRNKENPEFSTGSKIGLDSERQSSINGDANLTEELNGMKLLNLEEVRQFLGIGQWSLSQLINKNQLRTVRIGPRRFVSVNALKEYLVGLDQLSQERGNHGI